MVLSDVNSTGLEASGSDRRATGDLFGVDGLSSTSEADES